MEADVLAGSWTNHVHDAASAIGITLSLRKNVAIATVIARKGMREELSRRVKAAFDLSLPDLLSRSEARGVAFASAAPDQWLAASETMDREAFEASLRSELVECASITNQSDGRTIFRLKGPKARDALKKGVPIDLHSREFKPGSSAVTLVAHMNVHMWQCDEVPTYEFAVFRSFSRSFFDFLIEASAEFGVSIEH
jgi:sarcosine oxidase subunit gamma